MDTIEITQHVSVAPQIAVTDMAALRTAGFASVISNRPDGESADQPSYAQIKVAARRQAPVVADNVITVIHGKFAASVYDGCGSCPLTVERSQLVLAGFGSGGKLLPSFPELLNDGTQPSPLVWMQKAQAMPQVDWHVMLKGREGMVEPQTTNA